MAITLCSASVTPKRRYQGRFLQARIEHLIPALGIEIVGGEVEAGFAGRFTVAEAGKAGAAAERDLADGGGGVAQGEAIVVELDAGGGDFKPAAERPGTSARTFFNCAVPVTWGEAKCFQAPPMIEIDGRRTGEGDFGHADANGTGKLLEALEGGIALEVQSEALVVENSIDRGRSAGAERQIEALHDEGTDGVAAGLRGMAAIGGAGRCPGGVDHGHSFG